ncbi:hypothetical protein NHE_0245 [Neorickettsia helminthoeca str. Oregon]|uniref:Uncharacterized protein n=1 Tax=Neorickettsia helminthoeca str. Oregon TaxID=1286528 RepID=X5GVV4_9RICK|nr:hypothetical protein NHE_0245 [Neorickettsia helminthoeca str. Oregon]
MIGANLRRRSLSAFSFIDLARMRKNLEYSKFQYRALGMISNYKADTFISE